MWRSGCQLSVISYRLKKRFDCIRCLFHRRPKTERFSKETALITILLAAVFLLSTAFGAPDVPLNLDGWVAEALAKLETDGITGGFHRHTAPFSRADVAAAIRQAELRIGSGVVVPSPIDRKLLEKLKREFAKELRIHDGRRMRFLPQLSGDRRQSRSGF